MTANLAGGLFALALAVGLVLIIIVLERRKWIRAKWFCLRNGHDWEYEPMQKNCLRCGAHVGREDWP